MATTNTTPMRRGSLVGPMIVLGLGVIFLINNLRPDFSLWRLVARYWPFLLIFWGAARLLEYFVARVAGRPVPRAMSAGEIVLGVLICLMGSAFFFAERADWRFGRWRSRSLEVLGQNYEFPVQASRKAPANATVVVQNPQGNVRVVGADVHEIRVSGQKSVRAYDRPGAEQADKATPLEISEEGGRIYIRSNLDKASGERRLSAELEVTVPKTVTVQLEGRLGDFDVRDVAAVDVNSANAGVRLSNIARNARVSLRRSDVVEARKVSGNVEIHGRGRDIELVDIAGTVLIEGAFSGNIKLQNVARPVRYQSSQTDLTFEKLPGRMEMDLGSLSVVDVVGPFRLTAHNKDVRLEDFTREVEITARRGDLELRTSKAPLAAIQAESSSGNIRLELPGGARFQLQATATNGHADNEFGDPVKVERRGNSSELRGGVAGAPSIRLNTKRGNITFRKAGPPTQSL